MGEWGVVQWSWTRVGALWRALNARRRRRSLSCTQGWASGACAGVRDRLVVVFVVIIIIVVNIVVGAGAQCRRSAALVHMRLRRVRVVPVAGGVAANAGARLRLWRRREPGVPVVLLAGERRRVHEVWHGEVQLLELLHRNLATDCEALINYAS